MLSQDMLSCLISLTLAYEYDELVRFVLTVRKNYRRVAYHNWTHGWSVAHAMYLILKQTNVFTLLEVGHTEGLAPRGYQLRERPRFRPWRCTWLVFATIWIIEARITRI